MMRTHAGYVLFETSNPRHAHEWTVFKERADEVPEDKILIPGVLDCTTNFVEHPDVVTQRLERFTSNLAEIASWQEQIVGLEPLPDLGLLTQNRLGKISSSASGGRQHSLTCLR